MKVKFHRTVQNTTYYTNRKLNTSRDTLSSRDPCCRLNVMEILMEVVMNCSNTVKTYLKVKKTKLNGFYSFLYRIRTGQGWWHLTTPTKYRLSWHGCIL